MQRSDFFPSPDAVDGAHYQIPDGVSIDLDQVRRNSQFDMLIWKATQGTKSKDKTFPLVRKLAHTVGFQRFLPYHWLSSTPDRSITNAREQASHHLDVVGKYLPNELFSLDAEEEGITVETCCAILDAVEQGIDGQEGTGKPSDVYTGLYVAGGSIVRDPRIRKSKFGTRTIHVAAYVSADNLWNRIVQLGLQNLDIDAWQWSSKFNMPGIHTRDYCDINQIINQTRFKQNMQGATKPPATTPPVIIVPPNLPTHSFPSYPQTTPPTLGGNQVFKRIKVLKPGANPSNMGPNDTFGAVFYGMVSSNGIIERISWSGDGANPKVAKRYDAYDKLQIPWQYIDASQCANILLDPPIVPVESGVNWSLDQFANV